MRKKLIVLQEEISDCGVCSLLSIIRYYNGNISLEQLRMDSLTTKEGVTAYNLINCAQKYGFDAKGVKTSELSSVKLPCIAHLNINKSLSHFVVIYQVSNNSLVLMDPSVGRKVISSEEFDKYFSGIVILLYPKSEIPNYSNNNILLQNYISFFKNHKLDILKIFLIDLIVILTTIFMSFQIRALEQTENILLITIIFVFVGLINAVSIYFLNRNILRYNNKMNFSMQTDFIDHIFELPLKYIHMKDSGEIVKRFDNLQVIKDTILNSLLIIGSNALILVSAIILLAVIDVKVMGIITAFSVLYFGFVVLLNRKVIKLIYDDISTSTDYNTALVDYICGLTSVKHTKAKKFCMKNMEDKLTSVLKSEWQLNNYIERNEAIKEFTIMTIEIIVNSIIFIDIINGNTIFSSLFLVNGILSLILSSLNRLSSLVPSILYSLKLIRKINEFYAINETNSNNIFIPNGNIVFDDVSFSYNNYNYVLKDFSVKINEGEKVVIKGASGCGKSTLCRLLNCEYSNYSGAIKIGNVNIKNFGNNDVKNLVAYSSQTEKIFAGTIRDNIVMGRNISAEKIDEIVHICCLDELLKNKPYQLETFLYGGGEELSGGERQRIILARSLIGDEPIIILDETLSEVSEKIESSILKNIFEYYPQKTFIYVTHKNQKNYFEREIYV